MQGANLFVRELKRIIRKKTHFESDTFLKGLTDEAGLIE